MCSNNCVLLNGRSKHWWSEYRNPSREWFSLDKDGCPMVYTYYGKIYCCECTNLSEGKYKYDEANCRDYLDSICFICKKKIKDIYTKLSNEKYNIYS